MRTRNRTPTTGPSGSATKISWTRRAISLSQFRLDPDDSRYRGVERDAEVIRREEFHRRAAAQKNLIEMRGRWRQPTVGRTPLTMTVIVLSILVTVFGGTG